MASVGLVVALLVLHFGTARAQEATEKVLVKKDGVVEEFSVLKTDKTIRQGAYIRYRPLGGRAGVAVLEAGNYEHGLKEGEWRSFYEEYPWNMLHSKGTYHAGLPDGLWQYYHCFWLRRPGEVLVVANGRKTKAGLLVSLDDTTVVLQAKGMNHNGVRVGVWSYYAGQNAVIQQINQANGQLVYWRPGEQAPLSGPALAATHPVVYVGGKTLLVETLHHGLDINSLQDSQLAGSAEFVFQVDSAGQQMHVDLRPHVLPNQYEAFMLSNLNRLSTHWLPQMVAGHPVAATYPVRITVVHKDSDNTSLQIEALGE